MVKNMVKQMGKVENLHLLVMPEDWYQFIMSKGKAGDCPKTFKDCQTVLETYTGKLLQKVIKEKNNI